MEQKVIVMSGLPGSGKSTVAEGIATKLHFPLFSVDPITSAILESGIDKGFETGLAGYQVAKVLAAEQLKLGNSVIIDAVNAEEEGKDMWRSLAREYKVPLVIIETALDESVHKKRIESRVRYLHGMSEETWDGVIKRREVYTQWKEPVLRLDTALALDANIDAALKHLGSFS